MKRKSVAFIGSGNMAEALIKGMISSRILPASSITACDIVPSRLEYLSETYGVNTSERNGEGAQSCDIVVLSVKPQNIDEALESIASAVGPSKLVISIAAGVKLGKLESALGEGVPVIRSMPNAPALVGSGITAIVRGASVTDLDIEDARMLLGAVGEVMEIEEDFMDAVTAISGSGPAYFFFFIEALVKAALHAGLPKDVARKLSHATAIGSIKWLEETGALPSVLREVVTSHGGTTGAAIRIYAKSNFEKIVADAVEAAIKRSKELGGD